jgi:hypothetical protein
VEIQDLHIVEGSAPSEKEKEPIRSFGVRGTGNVGTPATRDTLNIPHEKKLWMMVMQLD